MNKIKLQDKNKKLNDIDIILVSFMACGRWSLLPILKCVQIVNQFVDVFDEVYVVFTAPRHTCTDFV